MATVTAYTTEHIDDIEEAISLKVANHQTVTAYTFVLDDKGKVVEADHTSPITITIPTNFSVPFPIGSLIEVCQIGTGQVSIAPDTGVTLVSPLNYRKIAGQSYSGYLRKRDTNAWILQGSLVA